MRFKPCAEHPFAIVAVRGGIGERPIAVATAATVQDAWRVKRRLQRTKQYGQLTICDRPLNASANDLDRPATSPRRALNSFHSTP